MLNSIQTTEAQTRPIYRLRSATARAENFRLDAVTKHRIYDRVLHYSSAPQIRHRLSGQTLKYVLHPQTRAALGAHADEIESQIIEDAEYSGKYEVIRRVPGELSRQMEKGGTADSIIDLRIVPVPNWLLNCFICEKLLETFSRRELLACPGFVEIESADEKGVIRKRIEMDLSEHLCRRGFMRPVFRGDLISALRIYRHCADDYPFTLRSRFGGLR